MEYKLKWYESFFQMQYKDKSMQVRSNVYVAYEACLFRLFNKSKWNYIYFKKGLTVLQTKKKKFKIAYNRSKWSKIDPLLKGKRTTDSD